MYTFMYIFFVLIYSSITIVWSMVSAGGALSNESPSEPTPASVKYCEWGIKLNTNFPFIGNCIKLTNNADGEVQTQESINGTTLTIPEGTIFQALLTAMSKIVMSLVLVWSLVTLIYAWFTAIQWDRNTARWYIKIVIWVIALLGTASVILKAINPNFFGN